MKRTRFAALSIAVLALVLGGCASGSKAIRADFAAYNQALQFNESQQMLLNLVRMKYRESPLFLKVGALSESYSFEASANASIGKAGTVHSSGLGVGSSVSSRPTITYTPVEGATFVKQVLAEIEPTEFILLVRSGWPLNTLCHILVERIGNEYNKESDPTYGRFQAVVEALQEAQENHALDLITRDETTYVRVRSERLDLYRPEKGTELKEHLIPLPDVLFRSFLDVMYFLGKNTQVPEAHKDRVKEQKPNGWITIRVTPGEPDDAMVSVEHDGYYFSIANTDVRSKDTFALLKILFQMQSGDMKSVQPVLTLPIAAP